MAFQIKNFVSIVGSIINHMRGTQTALTDFNVGSVARTMIEAPGIELDEFYQQMWNGLKEAIPVATYNSFNFDRLLAIPASGLVRVTITSSLTNTLIPAGTVLSSPAARTNYISESDVTILAGSTFADILGVADGVGTAGNLPANTAFSTSPVPAGFVSAINASAFDNGRDDETDDQRKQRFVLYISTLQRGTVAALSYGAKTTALYDANGLEIERVKAVSVVEPWVSDSSQPISLVNVFVHNGVGSTSGTLVAQVATVLAGYTDVTGAKVPGWKAAGVKVVVAPATEVALAMTATLTAAAGYDAPTLRGLANAALNAYILALDIGESFIFAEAIALVMAIPGVTNFVFTTPTADHTATSSQKLMPGTTAIS